MTEPEVVYRVRSTLTSLTHRLTITNDTAAILAKILQKRASEGRWRPNRKWKYGSDPIFRLSDPDFLFDFLYIMGSISNRYGACTEQNTARSVTFTLLASQLDITEPEVVYRERPWPLGPIAWPSRTIRRPFLPKYCKKEPQEAAGGQTGSGNMVET